MLSIPYAAGILARWDSAVGPPEESPQALDAKPGPSPPFATMKGSPEDLQEERTWWLDGAAAVASWARVGCPLSSAHIPAEMLPLVPWH